MAKDLNLNIDLRVKKDIKECILKNSYLDSTAVEVIVEKLTDQRGEGSLSSKRKSESYGLKLRPSPYTDILNILLHTQVSYSTPNIVISIADHGTTFIKCMDPLCGVPRRK